jgi:hypothetical protein
VVAQKFAMGFERKLSLPVNRHKPFPGEWVVLWQRNTSSMGKTVSGKAAGPFQQGRTLSWSKPEKPRFNRDSISEKKMKICLTVSKFLK